MEEVFSNRDLVRHLLSFYSETIPLLSASKAMRTSEECRHSYESWAKRGCPATPTEKESRCLAGVGGRNGAFCNGVFHLNGNPIGFDSFLAALLTTTVDDGFRGDLYVEVHMHPTVLHIHIARQANGLFTTHDGWRRKGSCSPTPMQIKRILTEVITHRQITLPCSNARRLTVPRAIKIMVWKAQAYVKGELLFDGYRT
jgi:hypothetical protein